MKMEQTVCSKTSTHKIQTQGYHPKEKTYEDGTDCVPKRRHIKFRRRETTQKKEPMKMEQTVFRKVGI